jgi:hypothetical protein
MFSFDPLIGHWNQRLQQQLIEPYHFMPFDSSRLCHSLTFQSFWAFEIPLMFQSMYAFALLNIDVCVGHLAPHKKNESKNKNREHIYREKEKN